MDLDYVSVQYRVSGTAPYFGEEFITMQHVILLVCCVPLVPSGRRQRLAEIPHLRAGKQRSACQARFTLIWRSAHRFFLSSQLSMHHLLAAWDEDLEDFIFVADQHLHWMSDD